LTVTGTGVNVAGTLNTGIGIITTTGNITGGNIIGIIAAGSNAISTTGNITGGNIIASNSHIHSIATGISAAGTTQTTATAITKDFNVVSTVLTGNGVVLPLIAGMRMAIINTSANALLVYPGTNGIINSQAANASYSMPAGGKLDFLSTTTTQWYTLNATYN
jgi:hypothetical protein